jgi:hypothetical protein
MRRLFLLAAVTVELVTADPRQELIDLFASMASALSEANSGAFLRVIDPAMPGYERFAADVNALAQQNALSSAIEIKSQKGDDLVQIVELNWLLEITGKEESRVVRREVTVKCRLERRKKKWRIVALDPMNLFAPPGAEADK